MLPKRLHTFSKVLAISALSSCLPVMAQQKNGWQYDSLGSESDATKPDAQRVYEVLLKMLDRWNAHDIEGHLEAYWKSPELLVVSILSSLMAGSNSMIPTLTGIRIVVRWGSLNPVAFKSSSSSRTFHSPLLGGPSTSRVPSRRWSETP